VEAFQASINMLSAQECYLSLTCFRINTPSNDHPANFALIIIEHGGAAQTIEILDFADKIQREKRNCF